MLTKTSDRFWMWRQYIYIYIYIYIYTCTLIKIYTYTHIYIYTDIDIDIYSKWTLLETKTYVSRTSPFVIFVMVLTYL